ncbi:ABC transporter permease [Variovorax boronicumulans]|uniref:ABC transporter permease n=1 Tax=Variovorax boronicumulans TaxID=436515 RepID=UPI001C59C692
MGIFLLRRLSTVAILLLGVSVLGFLILNLAPGGPLSLLTATGDMSQEDINRLAAQMGLNDSLPVQYMRWAGNLLAGDWGRSYRDQLPVLEIIASRLGATLLLMLTATGIAVLLGTWIGVISGVRRGGLFDTLTSVFFVALVSIPTFWLGLVAIYLFSVKLGWLPAGGRETPGDGSLTDVLSHLLMPALVLAMVHVAIWSRYMRASVLDAISQDYVRTARAKGLSESRILWRHVLPNSLLPMISIAGMQLPAQLGGALVTETVFTWPGMGRLFMDSLNYRDYPVVLGVLMLTALLTLIASLIADVCYAIADPRVRPT